MSRDRAADLNYIDAHFSNGKRPRTRRSDFESYALVGKRKKERSGTAVPTHECEPGTIVLPIGKP